MAATAAARRFACPGVASLSHRLTKQFTAADGASTRNLVFSPLSIYSALSLVAAGGQGKTLSELLGLLGASSRDDLAENVRSMVASAIPSGSQPGGPHVLYASGLWHDASRALKPAYSHTAATSCQAVARAVDFRTKPKEAERQINSWVAESTSNLIDSIVDSNSVDTNTRLVVTNAVYFKGKWETPFYGDDTWEDKFHRLDGSTVDAMFMSSSADQYIAVHDGFKVLKMPYRAHDPFAGMRDDEVAAHTKTMPLCTPPRYSMCVFLPDARDGLWSILGKIASGDGGFLREHLPEKRVKVGRFQVPKLKMSFSASVSRALQDLGIEAVFSDRAELPDMLEDDGSGEPLFLTDVVHKAVIDVNEQGTEAAAATGCFKKGCSRFKERPVLVDFVADHPFAFFVLDEVSDTVLFAGHVLDPTRSQ